MSTPVIGVLLGLLLALPLARAGGAESPSAPPPGATLSLEQAVRIGLATHPLLDRARYAALAAKAIVKQTEGQLYPWLEASAAGSAGAMRIVSADGKVIHDRGGHGFDPGGALPHHNQNMVTGGLILNQLLTDFGTTGHRILASQADQAASEKEILTHRALVVLNVQQAYFHCLMQERLVEVAEAALAQRRTLAEQVQTLYRRELKSKLDLDLLLVEVANAELALIQAKNELARRFAVLNHAMGLQGADRYVLERLLVEPKPPPAVESLLAEALRHRPELLGAQDRMQAKDAAIQAAQALHFGSITAVGTIGITQYGDVHDSGIPKDGLAPFWGAGATAKLPIFTGFRITNQIKEARHRRGEAEQELQQLANEVVLQVVRAHLAQATNAEQIPLERERVAYAKEALQLARERYRLGLSPIVEVIRATTALFDAEARLVEAQYIYKTSEAAVSFAAGRTARQYDDRSVIR
ncbi:TolC family protein [Nitrospira sp. Kam-Ns4a]